MDISVDDKVVKKVARFLPLAVIAGVVLAYANSFSGQFIFDDYVVITQNPKIYHLWPPWHAVLQITRPVADISFAINYAIGRFNVADYHLTNLIIHMLAALFLYGFVRRTLLLPRWEGQFDLAASWLASAVALIWAVHPLQTESVTYIAQRIEAMMGLFYLMSLYCFARGATAANPRWWMDASLLACLLGIGTKEMAVTLPVCLVIYDWVFVAPDFRSLLRARWKLHVAMFLTLAVFGQLLLLLISQQMNQGGLMYTVVSPFRYLLNETLVILYYFKLSFIPHPLCLDYAWKARPVAQLILPAIMVGILAIWAAYGVVRRRWYGFIGAFFFLVLATTSSIVPVPDFVFEHRMYLPLAAVITMVVMLLFLGGRRVVDEKAARRSWAFCGGVAVMIVATVFVLMTRARNMDYVTEEIMWRDIVAKAPDNFRAYNGLSSTLINRQAFPEAMQVCRDLLARLPDFGAMTADAIGQKARRDPAMAAKRYFYVLAHSNLGAALYNLDRLEEAQSHNVEALRVFPSHAMARNNMAFILYRQKKIPEAIEQWYEVLRWDSKGTKAHFLLGVVFSERGEYAKAIHHYKKELELRPDEVVVQYRLAWLLTVIPDNNLRDGQEALMVARKVNATMLEGSVRGWDLLGMAYAETGDFSNAVKAVTRALALATNPPAGLVTSPIVLTAPVATSEGNDYPVDAMTNRLQMYQDRRPFRHTATSNDGFPFW